MALIEEYNNTNYIIIILTIMYNRQANGNEHGHYWMLQEIISQVIFFCEGQQP